MSIYQCHCGKDFNSNMALSGHKRSHSALGYKTPFISKVCVIATREEITSKFFEEYLSQLSNCSCCGAVYKKESAAHVFCSRTCRTSTLNKSRVIKSGVTKEFTCISCRSQCTKSNRANPAKVKCDACVTSELLERRKNKQDCRSNTWVCAHCRCDFVSTTKRKYCESHRDLYSESAKGGYKFTFNVYDYPTLFDLAEITRVGFFCPGGRYSKDGKTNKNGLSRDHKVSVNEAIRNNYDPFYIKHPLNCEIMLHSENNKKKTNSSMTYQQLVEIVDEYEKLVK